MFEYEVDAMGSIDGYMTYSLLTCFLPAHIWCLAEKLSSDPGWTTDNSHEYMYLPEGHLRFM
jgi:hypothetical protein